MQYQATYYTKLSVKSYHPFGMQMPGRSYTSESYRFGFNGKELDTEGMGGGGSTYDYGFRIYNPQLGKFLSVDPLFKSYPWYTPYQFAGNIPIMAIDLDGLEEYVVIFEHYYNQCEPVVKILYESDSKKAPALAGGDYEAYAVHNYYNSNDNLVSVRTNQMSVGNLESLAENSSVIVVIEDLELFESITRSNALEKIGKWFDSKAGKIDAMDEGFFDFLSDLDIKIQPVYGENINYSKNGFSFDISEAARKMTELEGDNTNINHGNEVLVEKPDSGVFYGVYGDDTTFFKFEVDSAKNLKDNNPKNISSSQYKKEKDENSREVCKGCTK